MLLRPLLFIFLWTTLSILPFESSANEQMPEWQLQNSQGEVTGSSDFTGRPVVIHFWATWCPYCKKLQPGLEELKQEYANQGIQFVAISFREDEGALPHKTLLERGISIPTLINGDHVALELFGVEGTPTTLFIDHTGEIIGATRTSNPEDPVLTKATQYLLEKYREK